ncbi:MAG TPA: response regulator [Candidatus Methylacidiphilales bacterium]|nr:response regulator [Candidatus Methylacidiphilales bacterium]
MKTKLQILHIEDSPEDSELIEKLLSDNGLSCAITRVETRRDVFDALEKRPFDLILSDCKLPGFDGMRALEIAHALKPETPFVFVSGTIGEETAIESLRNGATDYVLKDRLTRLVPAVKRALAEAEEHAMCRQLQQRLREAGRLEAISTLSNGIAHDFNNILTIILGHASLLPMERGCAQRVQEISHTISDAARRGSEIVQQLLAFARKSDGHVAPTDLNRYITAHLNAIKEKLPDRVGLAFEPAANLPRVLIDASQLDRILDNLVTNSVDAMAARGHIVISTSVASALDVPDLLPEFAAEEYVRLVVADDGKGIDADTRQHVFEPFFTTKERGRGTGLGLPVVYGLMQAHRGYVDVKSEIGRGTSISLYFPVPRSIVVPSAPLAHQADPALSGTETILVVEDEADVRVYLETVLRTHNYAVHSAADVEEAIEVFKNHRDEISLVFSDVGLPKVDGIALGLKLRELKPGLPIVLASGYPTKDFRERINELGAQAFLAKPYNTQDILLTVRRALTDSTTLHLSA